MCPSLRQLRLTNAPQAYANSIRLSSMPRPYLPAYLVSSNPLLFPFEQVSRFACCLLQLLAPPTADFTFLLQRFFFGLHRCPATLLGIHSRRRKLVSHLLHMFKSVAFYHRMLIYCGSCAPFLPFFPFPDFPIGLFSPHVLHKAAVDESITSFDHRLFVRQKLNIIFFFPSDS